MIPKTTGYKFKYENNHATVTLIYKDLTFTGTAICHPEDEDFCSERVGLCIAEARAYIKFLQYLKNHEFDNQLKILMHFYSNIKTSKFYNPDLYEVKRLKGQIAAIKKEIEYIRNTIKEEKQYLKSYIDQKDAMYKKLRSRKRSEE